MGLDRAALDGLRQIIPADGARRLAVGDAARRRSGRPGRANRRICAASPPPATGRPGRGGLPRSAGTRRPAGRQDESRLHRRGRHRRVFAAGRDGSAAGPGHRYDAQALQRDGYLLVASLLDEMLYRILMAWDANPDQDVGESGVVHTKLGLSDPISGRAVSIRCWRRPRSGCLARTGIWAGWGCARRCPVAAIRICILTTSRAGGRTGAWRSLSAMWCISAFTSDNGPLRVIPGSHRVSGEPGSDEWLTRLTPPSASRECLL